MCFVCVIVCDEVDGRMYYESANNPTWFLNATSVTAVAPNLQYWYGLSALRFAMCVCGGALAVLEFEERLTVADVDFATPKDRFV